MSFRSRNRCSVACAIRSEECVTSATEGDSRRNRIFAQKGYIYLRSGLYEEARDMQELARTFCTQIGDTAGVRFSTEDIATIDTLMQTTQRDTSSLMATRQSCNILQERAHNKVLRLQNEQQKKDEEKGGGMMPVALVAGILSAVLGILLWKRMGRKPSPEEGRQVVHPGGEGDVSKAAEASPVRRAFYDAEIDELLQSRLKADKTLKPAEWRWVEERLLAAIPTFRSTLYSHYELSETEYRICMLIKMEMAPSNMARILAMGASSVSQSRLRMQQKVFNGNGTAKDWDNYIQSL